MTKTKDSASATTSATESLDYQQLAQHMLGSWQEQWRQFATNKDNPFATNTFADGSYAGDANPYSQWLKTWSSAMAAWQQPQQPPHAESQPAASAAPASFSDSHKAEPHARTEPNAASASGHQPAAAPSVSAPAAAASSARDVLLTELARRVEFLHERVVALESELDRIKGCK